MSRGRILFLSQWFDPEPAAIKGAAFVRALIQRGFEIEVATGFPNYPTGRIAEGYTLAPYTRQVMDGIVVHRLWLYPSHDRNSLGRAINYLSFGLTALIFCLLKGRRYDAVYVYHPPITTGVAAALAGLVNRRSFAIEIQDLWPDSVAASGMDRTGLMARILGPVCRWIHGRASRVVAQSRGMADRLATRGARPERLAVVYNWADEEDARPRGVADLTPYRFGQGFTFVFGGNLGAVQGLDVLIKAAVLARETEANVRLILVGDGVERERLAALIAELKAENISLHPPIPRSHIGDVFSAADALTLHLDDDPLFEITVPSKTQFYMAVGRPILVCVNGEARRLVLDAGAGIAAPPGDVDAIAAAMVEMAHLSPTRRQAMARAARGTYVERFSAQIGLDATARVLDDLIAPGRRARPD